MKGSRGEIPGCYHSRRKEREDGDFAEPDGYVDHLLIIHSGAGQVL